MTLTLAEKKLEEARGRRDTAETAHRSMKTFSLLSNAPKADEKQDKPTEDKPSPSADELEKVLRKIEHESQQAAAAKSGGKDLAEAAAPPAEATPSPPEATNTTGEVDQNEKPIFDGWIYVGDMNVGCKGGAVSPTPATVLFDTGSSLLVLKTQKTFDVVAKHACEKINEMFVGVSGCEGG